MNQLPSLFPPTWASAFGEDSFGLWAMLMVGGVTQRLRWIAPGHFLMGAEPGRKHDFTDEQPQHSVSLTQGFWLADTACTQAFWRSIVGSQPPKDPSNNEQNPVKRVSWDDIVKTFLPRLQSLLGEEIKALLPSEAEWEYACRAGTATPFSFGEAITRKQVNYNDNARPGHIVPVASLPPNSWGLYEMHGNVLEWCRDGPRRYDEKPGLNPEGHLGSFRALRGGAWTSTAKSVRSSSRRAASPDLRERDVGFRFSLAPL